MKKKYMINRQEHPYHIVTPSPWPFLVAFSVLNLVTSLVMYFHEMIPYFFYCICPYLIWVILTISFWFNDIVYEAVYEGDHTKKVQYGLRIGMILFILSEVMFFLSIFWAFFHLSLNPSFYIGCIWPPKGIIPLNPWSIPLLNTIILVSSGITITWAHRAITAGFHKKVITALILTIFYGILFTGFQVYEYINAPFNINDSVYGSIFYLATGFHGFHVLIGTIFLIVTLIREINYHFMKTSHFGFEAAAWYWHFVDVVWLFLFISVYIWGGR